MQNLLPYLLACSLLSALMTWAITYFSLRRRAWRIEIESWKAARRFYRNANNTPQ